MIHVSWVERPMFIDPTLIGQYKVKYMYRDIHVGYISMLLFFLPMLVEVWKFRLYICPVYSRLRVL